MNRLRCALMGSACVLLAGALQADWFFGDAYKMHHPQLPDPNGWDVIVSQNNFVADDFLCTQTGPITDIHFWGSWKDDLFNDPLADLINIQLTIYGDVPAGVDATYSHPTEDFLWQYQTDLNDPALVTVRAEAPSAQGWYDPLQGLALSDNHSQYFQYNVSIDPDEWFVQQQGTIYWLEVHVVVPEQYQFGWKTSLDIYNDDSTYRDPAIQNPDLPWFELIDPVSGESLHQAFVIVPEPGELAFILGMLVFGFCLIRRQQR